MKNLIFAGLLIFSFALIGCAQLAAHKEANQPAPAQGTGAAASTDIGTAGKASSAPGRPACLNILDGDWRVEFNGRQILVGAANPLRALALDQGLPVHCTRMEIINGAQHGSALIEFTTDTKGTSIGVTDKMLGVVLIKEGRWLVAPVVIERHFESNDKVETKEMLRADWLLDSSGRPLLTLTSASSHKSESFSP